MTLSMQTDYFKLLHNAAQYFNNDQLQEAKLLALQLTSSSISPTNEHFRLLAHIAHKEENFSLALSFIEKGLKISQDNHHLFYELKGLALQKLESHKEARIAFKNSLSLNYKQLPSIKNYFSSSLNINNPKLCKEALDTCGLLLSKIDSNEDSDLFAEIQNYKGIALLYLKDYKNGLNAFLLALKTGSINSEFFFNVGYAYFHLKDYKKCIEYLNQGIYFDPNNPLANEKLAECHFKLKQFENAYEVIDKALNTDSENCSLNLLLARIYEKQKSYEKSEELFKKTLDKNPSFYRNYLFNHSLNELIMGNFKEGWKLYSHRIHLDQCALISNHIKTFKKPIWQGESLTNKSILVHYEQGAGDSLQFCRYLPWLANYTDKIYFLIHNHLVELFEYNRSLLKFTLPPPNFIDDISYQIPLMQLPLIHQTDFNNMLNATPYLKADPERKTLFQDLISTSKLKIGIFWQSSPSHGEDRYRSNKLKDWLPLIQQFKDKVQFYSLQKGFGEEQLNEIDNDGSLIPLGSYFHNYADTAAAIDMLDLVISVDSSVVHLCGALGKTTWILLPLDPDWRWLLDREDSPWYPTARLFRKQKDQTWSDVLSKVAHQLQLSFF